MKQILIISAFLVAVGCRDYFSSDEKIKAFLPGTYVNIAESEFSKAIDTLIIIRDGIVGNTYTINRHVSFQRIKNGVFRGKEYETEQWIGIYDDKDKVLHETKKGRIISYVPEESKLYLGNSEYEKVQ